MHSVTIHLNDGGCFIAEARESAVMDAASGLLKYGAFVLEGAHGIVVVPAVQLKAVEATALTQVTAPA